MTIQIITNFRREMKVHLEGFIYKDVFFIQDILGRIKFSIQRSLLSVIAFFTNTQPMVESFGRFSRESISGILPSVLFSKDF